MNHASVKNRRHPSVGAQGTVSLLFSIVVHLAMILILACWVVVAGNPTQGLSLLFQNESASELPSLRLAQEIAVESTAQNDEASLANIEKPVRTELNLSTEPVELDLEEDLTTHPFKFSLASANLRESSTATGSHDSEANGEGQGASFFGAYATGNQFVYVLDSSSSMMGERWLYARQKLIQSLRQLGPEREFYVICFDHKTTLMFDSDQSSVKFEKANSLTIQKVERWLRYRELGMDTMPSEALQFAISMKPDAIFLLSDGELKDNSLLMLRILNASRQDHRQVPIHTIHLLSPFGRATLEIIAKDNAGTFTLVDEEQNFSRRLK